MRWCARDDSPRRIRDRDRRGFIPVGKTRGRRAGAAAWPRHRADSDARGLPQDLRGARGAAGRDSRGIFAARAGASRTGFPKPAFFAARKTADRAGAVHRQANQRRRREPGIIRDAAAGARGARPRRAGARRRYLHRRSETAQHDGDDAALCRDGTAPRQRRQGNARGGERAGVEKFGRKRRALEPVPELSKWNGDAARGARGAARHVDSQGRGSRRDVAKRRTAGGSRSRAQARSMPTR